MAATNPNLSELDLRGYDVSQAADDVAALRSLLAHSGPHLRHLAVDDFKGNGDPDPQLAAATQQCSQVTHLSVCGIKALTLLPPRVLPAHMQSLVRLELSGAHLKWRDFPHIAQLGALTHLAVSEVRLPSERPRSPLPLPPRLVELHLGDSASFMVVAALQPPASLVLIDLCRMELQFPYAGEEEEDEDDDEDEEEDEGEEDAALILAAVRQLYGRLPPTRYLGFDFDWKDALRVPGWGTLLATMAPLGLLSLYLPCMDITAEEMGQLVAALPGLEELDISEHLTRGPLTALSSATALTKLEALGLDDLRQPDQDGVTAPVPLPTNLRVLDVSCASFGFDHPHAAAVALLQPPPSLTHLELGSLRLDSEDLDEDNGMRTAGAAALLGACGVLAGRSRDEYYTRPFGFYLCGAYPPLEWGPTGWSQLWDAIVPLGLSRLELRTFGGLAAGDMRALAERLPGLQELQLSSAVPPAALLELRRFLHLQTLTVHVWPDEPEFSDWQDSNAVRLALLQLCLGAVALQQVRMYIVGPLDPEATKDVATAANKVLVGVSGAGEEIARLGLSPTLLVVG